jgi:hypothetical protein
VLVAYCWSITDSSAEKKSVVEAHLRLHENVKKQTGSELAKISGEI